MINVDPFLEKLEWLKEWVGLWLNRAMTDAVLIRWEEDANFIVHPNTCRVLISFEDYCNYKQSIQKHKAINT